MKPSRVLLLAALFLTGGPIPAQGGEGASPPSRAPWSPGILELFSRLPVQERGRVKPLSTHARFLILRLQGRQRVETPAGESLEPVAWLLDSLFWPELASTYRVFRLEDRAVLDEIGLRLGEEEEARRKRMDRYSYQEILPAQARLFGLARRFAALDQKQRTDLQTQVLHLANVFAEYRRLLHFLDFARRGFDLPEADGLRELFEGRTRVGLSAVLEKRTALRHRYHVVTGEDPGLSPERKKEERAVLEKLFQEVERAVAGADSLSLFPPSLPEEEEEEWMTPVELREKAFLSDAPLDTQVDMLATLEHMVLHRGEPERLEGMAESLWAGSRGLASDRGEYGKIESEVAFYRWDLIYRSLYLFGLAFVLVALSWLLPRSRLLPGLVTGTLVFALGVLVVAIGWRCFLRGRPPVSTLYETFLFITALAGIVSLVVEWINRQRVALAVAPLVGLVGILLANKYETMEGVDTMPPLVAVLDTNFWLATHVTSITAGYAAGLLGGFLAHVFLLGRLFDRGRKNRAFYKSVVRMVYGVFCFALLLSVAGTILGGIWANDSWGRFWGWDPKENGALMICLAQLILLHGRMGGYFRDFGFCLLAVAQNLIVAFSWFHVNLLGVGLHAYGFSSVIKRGLFGFYFLELAVLVLGCLAWYLARLSGQVSSRGTANVDGPGT